MGLISRLFQSKPILIQDYPDKYFYLTEIEKVFGNQKSRKQKGKEKSVQLFEQFMCHSPEPESKNLDW